MEKSPIECRASRTITRTDLATAVYRLGGLSHSEAARFVETFLAEVTDTIARGENVKLSSFGAFLVRSKAARVGRNPKTGIEAPITPRRVLVFKPSHSLKKLVDRQA